MNITLLKQIFKQNLSAILFFGLIAFGVGSFWLKNSQESGYAKELIDYADQSVPTLRTDFVELVKITDNVPNDDKTYDSFFSKLADYEKTVADLASKVPSKSGDVDTRKLELALKDFILTVNDETVKPLKEEYQQRKDLRKYQESFAELKNVASSDDSTKSDLQKGYEGGVKILEFNLKLEKAQTNLQKQASLKSNNTVQEKTLQDLKNLLEKSSEKLSDEQKNSLSKIFDDGWPVRPLLFSSVEQSRLENTSFVNNINQLKPMVTSLRQKFNL
jgi:hypothetical protein